MTESTTIRPVQCSLQFGVSAKYDETDILDSVKKLPLTLTDLNWFHLILSLQIFFGFSTPDIAFLLLLLLLLLLLFRVLYIFGLLTLLRALTYIKKHISSDVPKFKGCLVHVFCCLKICVEIRVGEKVYENACNVI